MIVQRIHRLMSPNGQFISFNDNGDIGLVNVVTGAIQKIPAQKENWQYLRAFPTSDGKWLAVIYSNNDFQSGGKDALKLLSMDGKQVVPIAAESDVPLETVVWSPDDGQWLGVMRQDSVKVFSADSTLLVDVPLSPGSGGQLNWQPCEG